LTSVGRADDEFAEKLVTWADVIRKTFADGGCDEVISTRRLVHIVETFGIFGDKMKSISLCLNRFDDDTKASFLDLYTKVDAGANTEVILASTISAKESPDDEQEEVDPF
jgi:cobaltochelatase CobS